VIGHALVEAGLIGAGSDALREGDALGVGGARSGLVRAVAHERAPEAAGRGVAARAGVSHAPGSVVVLVPVVAARAACRRPARAARAGGPAGLRRGARLKSAADAGDRIAADEAAGCRGV
jgi:hypothetical protein